MYKIIKPILFKFDAEKVHQAVMKSLTLVFNMPFGKKILEQLYDAPNDNLSKKVFGLDFKNPIGLAAGFDKNGRYIDELATLGFGFIEVGTVTPKAQNGNPSPRLFRLPKDEAIINRMGFNNDGVSAMIENLRNVKNKSIIIGGNIGKNKDTPNENAIHDYVYCFENLYNYVHYFVINVSSPNTPGLRELQDKGPLTQIINALIDKREAKEIKKPILLKIAPDLNKSQLDDIIEITNTTKLDGLVISNTTVSREGLRSNEILISQLGAGGLSGKPLLQKSNDILFYISSKINKPIIGVGGIQTPEDMHTKLDNGAALVQLYTGFVFEGPSIVNKLKLSL